MTHIIAKIIYSFIITSLCAGCIFDSDSKDQKNTGTYKLEVEPSEKLTYPGGGGVYLIEMKTSEDFSGKVLLSLSVNPNLNASLFSSVLTKDNTVTDVVVLPDTASVIGTYSIDVISRHAGKSDTLNLSLELSETYDDFLSDKDYHVDHEEYVSWLQNQYPELGINDSQQWTGFNNYLGILIGGSSWTFVCDKWVMTRTGTVYPFCKYMLFYVLRLIRISYFLRNNSEKFSEVLCSYPPI